MPTNETANIYSSELAEPTPTAASAVTYDNTNSGLAADDVQEAIDELASGIDTLDEAVDGKYAYTSLNETLEVRGDGVKTYSTLLTELHTLLQAKVTALATNEYLIPTQLFVRRVAAMGYVQGIAYDNSYANITLRRGGLQLFAGKFSGELSTHFYI